MLEPKYIKVEKLRIIKNQTVVSELSCSKNLEKYFRSKLLFAEYSKDVRDVSKSILYIPAISSLITFAWAIGVDVYVEELDKAFIESLEKIKTVMKRWYPKFSFSSNIHVDKIVTNTFPRTRYGLLFSGGLDSTCSFIRHRGKKPILVMVWGADVPLVKEEFWRKIQEKYERFVKEEKLEIHFVKTNIREFFDEKSLFKEFRQSFPPDSDWWAAVQHGLGLLGLCAPVTVAEHIGTLLIASSCTPNYLRKNLPWGSHPLIDNQLSWANVKVMHDAVNLSRQEKIRHVLKNYVNDYNRYPYLRVCTSQFDLLNCGQCEKCLRTIAGLVLENIDPNKCGFNIDADFFVFLRLYFSKSRRDIYMTKKTGMWDDIKRHIPNPLDHDLYGSREFWEWFRDFDISKKPYGKNVGWWFLYFFERLPQEVKGPMANLSVYLRRKLLKQKIPVF